MKDPRKLFESVVGKLPIILFAVDRHGVLSYSEGRGLELLGGLGGKGVGRHIEDLWRDNPEVIDILRRGLAGEEVSKVIELRGRAFDLLTTPAADGGVIGLARDVTRRVRAQEDLRTSQMKFSAAFRHSLDSVILTAVPSGEILEVNQGFSIVAEWQRDEAVGRTTRELGLWPELREREQLHARLQEDGKVEAMPVHIRRKSGEIRVCRLWGELLPVSGEPILLTVVRDVTGELRAEQERAGFIAELEAKHRELELYSMTVAHDLKEPLISIEGLALATAEDLSDGCLDEARRNLEMLQRSARRMGRQVEAILDLSCSGRVVESFGRLDMEAVVRQAAEPLLAGFRDHVQMEIASGLGHAYGDRRRILQVWQNLMTNAAKYRRDGLSVTVRVGRRDPSPQGRAVYFVADDGRGLAAEDLDHIFELYSRVDSDVGGTGLGLALVKKVVEVHGGTVWAESDGLDRGSTFCFSLPTERPGGES